jgi:hypothetical protein
MSGSLMEEVSTYLQNSGYTIEEQQGYCTFEHPEKMWFAVQETEKGLVFSTVVTGDTDLDPQAAENLSLVNLINRNSAISSFNISEEHGLQVKAFYPGLYDHSTFSSFLELWNHDLNLFFDMLE